MGKGDNRKSNKEVKKPKKNAGKPAPTATAASTRDGAVVAGKKVG